MTSHTGEVITSDLNSLKTAINIRLSWTTERHYFFLNHYNMVYLVSTFLNNIIFLRCCCIEHGIWRLLHYFCVAFFDVWFIVASLSRHSPEFPYAFMHMRTLQKPADQCKSSQKHDLCKSVQVLQTRNYASVLTTGRELLFQPHKFENVVSLNTRSWNYIANGTCDHSWLMMLLVNEPLVGLGWVMQQNLTASNSVMHPISKLITFNLTDLVTGANEYMTQVVEHKLSRWLNRFLAVCQLAGKKKKSLVNQQQEEMNVTWQDWMVWWRWSRWYSLTDHTQTQGGSASTHTQPAVIM